MRRTPVRRPRLIDQLEAASQCRVVLVLAGAGWGKTALVSSWADTRSGPTTWLTLDRQDNDAQVFWSYVVAALQEARAVPPGNPLADLRAAPADDVERVRHLAQGFNRLTEPTFLVLDDFQEIDDAKVLRELAGLLRHPPPRLHLIVISRSEPALHLHRLQASGDLAEIRSRDLAFTDGEAIDLLARHGLDPPGDDVTVLLDRTEGWPVGLQLAAAFLAGPDGPRPVADFAGDVRTVDEYLTHEILAGESPQRRSFLLDTSICEHLCGELADAVTGQTGGQQTLESLERDNDFVVRLGAKHEWFRYHRLLRDVLCHRLLLEKPAMVPELHRRAARWHAARQEVFEALGHAASARDWPYLARLVIAHAAPQILSAERSPLIKLLRKVPAEELNATAELMVCAVVMLFHAGDFDAMPDRLADVRRLLAGRPDADSSPLDLTIRALQVAAYRAAGDMPALIAETSELLVRLTKGQSAPIPSVLQYRAIALNNKGVGLLWAGHIDTAERHLSAGWNAARAAGLELVEINAVGHLALLEVMRRSVREASRLAIGACELAERRGWSNAVQAGVAQLALVLAHIEHNDLAEANRTLQRGLRASHQEPEAAQTKAWLGAQARLAVAQGDLVRARALIEQARRPADPGLRAPFLDRWLLLVEAELDLTTGHPDLVEARYGALAADGGLTVPEQVCRARAAFARRDLRRAEELLAGTCVTMPDTVAAVQAQILTALIADTRGHGLAAADALGRALALAEREEIRRPFIVAGGRLEALINRHVLLTRHQPSFATEIIAAMTSVAPEWHAGTAGDLSERETEILRYLPTMLTAGDIAGELGVSVNTVKAHMRSIYRKLDASRRREAVGRAYELGLL